MNKTQIIDFYTAMIGPSATLTAGQIGQHAETAISAAMTQAQHGWGDSWAARLVACHLVRAATQRGASRARSLAYAGAHAAYLLRTIRADDAAGVGSP
jgi:cytochrome c553